MQMFDFKAYGRPTGREADRALHSAYRRPFAIPTEAAGGRGTGDGEGASA
jgi:hypothetical protein